jgi:hypothetical protein
VCIERTLLKPWGRWPVSGARAADGQRVKYGIRPEHIDLAGAGIAAEVVVVEPWCRDRRPVRQTLTLLTHGCSSRRERAPSRRASRTHPSTPPLARALVESARVRFHHGGKDWQFSVEMRPRPEDWRFDLTLDAVAQLRAEIRADAPPRRSSAPNASATAS